MMGEFGIDSIEALADHIFEHSHAATLEEIGKLPFGTYRNSVIIDGYDHPIELKAALTISKGGIHVDFTGTSPVSSFGINVPMLYTTAYTSFGVKCLVAPAIPNNAGSLAPITVSAPEGSILNAPRPCAVAIRHVIGHVLPDVVFGCLHQALPSGAPAEGASALWIPQLRGGHGVSDTAAGGTPFNVLSFHAGGTGARPTKDGLSATAFPSGVKSVPVEIVESIAPVVIWRKEYRTDSGGPGRMRGGLGQVMEIGSAENAPFSVYRHVRAHRPSGARTQRRPRRRRGARVAGLGSGASRQRPADDSARGAAAAGAARRWRLRRSARA